MNGKDIKLILYLLNARMLLHYKHREMFKTAKIVFGHPLLA